MEQLQQTKEFITRYLKAFGVSKTRNLAEEYITDEELIGHIGF